MQQVDASSLVLAGSEGRTLVVSGSLKASIRGTLVKPRHFGLVARDAPETHGAHDADHVILCAACVHSRFLLLGTKSGILLSSCLIHLYYLIAFVFAFPFFPFFVPSL